jgi:type VI secretion system protein ImpA
MSSLATSLPAADRNLAAEHEDDAELAGFDLDTLLAPIPGTHPAGIDLRYAGDYDRIQEARREDDPSLPQGIWQRQLKRADWDEVASLCAEALARRSKDLQIAAWLVEAVVQRRGFSGLAPGFVLLGRLCELYWPDLFPAIEAGELDARLAPLDWLNTRLPTLLHQLPVTRASGTTVTAHSWADYHNAERHEVARQRDPKSAAKAEAAGRVTLQAFLDGVARTPNEFYLPLHAELSAGSAALASFTALLDECCGRQAPNLAGIRDAIGELEGWVGTILSERNALPPEPAPLPPEAEAENATALAADEIAPAGSEGAIRSREDAYRRLGEVAEYLFRTEPHSPTPYLVQRAVTWGRMPLHELLPELARRGDLTQLFELLGLPDRR